MAFQTGSLEEKIGIAYELCLQASELFFKEDDDFDESQCFDPLDLFLEEMATKVNEDFDREMFHKAIILRIVKDSTENQLLWRSNKSALKQQMQMLTKSVLSFAVAIGRYQNEISDARLILLLEVILTHASICNISQRFIGYIYSLCSQDKLDVFFDTFIQHFRLQPGYMPLFEIRDDDDPQIFKEHFVAFVRKIYGKVQKFQASSTDVKGKLYSRMALMSVIMRSSLSAEFTDIILELIPSFTFHDFHDQILVLEAFGKYVQTEGNDGNIITNLLNLVLSEELLQHPIPIDAVSEFVALINIFQKTRPEEYSDRFCDLSEETRLSIELLKENDNAQKELNEALTILNSFFDRLELATGSEFERMISLAETVKLIFVQVASEPTIVATRLNMLFENILDVLANIIPINHKRLPETIIFLLSVFEVATFTGQKGMSSFGALIQLSQFFTKIIKKIPMEAASIIINKYCRVLIYSMINNYDARISDIGAYVKFIYAIGIDPKYPLEETFANVLTKICNLPILEDIFNSCSRFKLSPLLIFSTALSFRLHKFCETNKEPRLSESDRLELMLLGDFTLRHRCLDSAQESIFKSILAKV